MKPQRILIMGLPGSGKTYFAEQLKKYLENNSNTQTMPLARMANLELMPMRMNSSKSDSIGERQVDMAKKFHAAGLLSKSGLDAVLAR